MKTIITAALKAGLLIGVLDIVAACLQYYIQTGKNPTNVLIYVASGVFGKAAFAGGTTMALTGLVFHFIISISLAIFFYLIFPAIKKLLRNNILIGILYAFFAWVVTRLIIVPLSNVPQSPVKFNAAATAIAILIFTIGLPLVFMADNYFKSKDNNANLIS